MNETLESILAGIAAGRLLDRNYYASIDCDQMLDRRDEEAFDNAWNACFEEVTALWDAYDNRDSMDERIDQIRREAFLAVSRASNQHDIAGYVSDDFELIARACVLGVVHPFVDCLWQHYMRGTFPDHV